MKQRSLCTMFAPRLDVLRRIFALAGFAGITAASIAAPTISKQPADVHVTAGQNATFTVAATGGSPMTFQWRRSGFPISGATTATFVVGAANRGQAGYYDVVVTDSTGATPSTVARLTVAPRQYVTTIAPDSAFTSPMETALNAFVTSVALMPDGGYAVAGGFARVDGQPRSMVMRVNPDQTLNTTFVSPTIIGNKVNAVAVLADGKVLIGGMFTRIGYYACNALARLNPDGSVDTTFKPSTSGMAYVSSIVVLPDQKIVVAAWPYPILQRLNPDGSLDKQLAPEITGTVNAIALQPDGGLVVVGPLSASIGAVTYKSAMRVAADGTVDTTFRAPAYGGVLQAAAPAGNGQVYVGGSPGSDATATCLLRLSATGAADSTFAANVRGGVDAIAVQVDGRVLVGGNVGQVNGQYVRNVARLNADGTLDAAFPAVSPVNPVRTLAVLGDGSIVAGGDDSVSGAVRHGLARYTAAGAFELTPNFAMHGSGSVGAIVRLPTGKYMVIGNTDFAGSTPSSNLVRLNADATIDPAFASTDPTLHGGLNINDAVALPDGRVAVATYDNGSPRLSLPVAVIAADGSLDGSFRPEQTSITSAATVALLPNGKLAVAGTSNITRSNPPAGIAVYNLDGSLDHSFPGGTPFDRAIWSLVPLADGKLLVGGYFTTFNGTATGSLVRLNPDGTLDTSFAPNPKFDAVVGVRLLPNGQIFVLGQRQGYADNPFQLFRLNSDGTLDGSFKSAAQFIDSFVPQDDGKVIVHSVDTRVMFSAIAPVRLNADGSIDPTFSAVGMLPARLANGALGLLREDGQLMYLDGAGSAKQLFASASSAAPAVTGLPATTTVALGGTLTLQPTVMSTIPVRYQWSLNGTSIPGATNRAYSVSGFSAANVGNYTVAATNDLGSVVSAPVAVTAPLDTGGHIINLSIRSIAGTGDTTLIVGFVLGGEHTGGTVPLLYRGVGPTLASTFGVAGALADPVLQLYDASSFMIDQNDDWNGVFDFASVGAFPFAGTAPKDAAIYNPYAANGAESMHVTGKAGATGIALAEIYDTTPDGQFTETTPRFINGSARAVVGSGDNVLILGFVIGGQASERLLIRGVGPTLGAAPYNVPGVLSDPQVEVYDAAHTKLAQNDNWGDGGAADTMAATFASVGAFPLASAASKDAAVVVTLPPGVYSAVVRGAAGQTGVALVELYELP